MAARGIPPPHFAMLTPKDFASPEWATWFDSLGQAVAGTGAGSLSAIETTLTAQAAEIAALQAQVDAIDPSASGAETLGTEPV